MQRARRTKDSDVHTDRPESACEIDIKAADGKTIKVAKPGEKPPDINLDL